jgi:hypothetical protein
MATTTPNPLFFLRAYNDIDHMTPIIWKFQEMGSTPHVIIYSTISIDNDYRIIFLKNHKSGIVIHRFHDEIFNIINSKKNTRFLDKMKLWFMSNGWNHSTFIGKLYRRLGFNVVEEINFLKKHEISQCIFEWGPPYSRGIIPLKFYLASKGLGLPTFSLPHGCNIYSHPNVNTSHTHLIERGAYPKTDDYALFDYFVLQNPTRRDQFIRWGSDPIKTQAWGSARFCPEWQKINLSICPEHTPKELFPNRLKVVFMHHQSNYNLKVMEIWNLLDVLAKQDWIHLLIKESTREGKSYSSKTFFETHKNNKNIEFLPQNAQSPQLIKWSDCIINFGSSIGMEAIIQNKPLITPTYLHTNQTLFEKFHASISAKSQEDTINCLKNIFIDKNFGSSATATGRQLILKEIVYGGKEEHNVLNSYYHKLNSETLNYI